MNDLFHSQEMPSPIDGILSTKNINMFFNYRCQFGTSEQLLQFKMYPGRVRNDLVAALRSAYPSNISSAKSFSEDAIKTMADKWSNNDAIDFDLQAFTYLNLELDSFEDRILAIRFLINCYGTKVSPSSAYGILCGALDSFAEITNSFVEIMAEDWRPAVQGNRSIILDAASILFDNFGSLVLTDFLHAVAPDLPNWPCDEDTLFVKQLMEITSSQTINEWIHNYFVMHKTPYGSECLTLEMIKQFLYPLWQVVSKDNTKCIQSYIMMWEALIPVNIETFLISCATTKSNKDVIHNSITVNNRRILSIQDRKRVSVVSETQ